MLSPVHITSSKDIPQKKKKKEKAQQNFDNS